MASDSSAASAHAEFEALKRRIVEETAPEDREWQKARVLWTCPSYLEFLSRLTGSPADKVKRCLKDFGDDDQFRAAFGPRLQQFESDDSLAHGDVRFHSLTLYAVGRLTRPEIVVETGVASGKSSAVLLLALSHNRTGRMVSIDLPNPPGSVLADGALSHTGNRDAGWLVPEYLRDRWDLRLGDARSLLPSLVAEVGEVDLFFHDSLHTREHVLFELNAVAPAMRSTSVLVVDNVDVADGALEDFAVEHDLPYSIFGDMGGARMDGRNLDIV